MPIKIMACKNDIGLGLDCYALGDSTVFRVIGSFMVYEIPDVSVLMHNKLRRVHDLQE